MTLRQKQSEFARMLALLLQYATLRGYEVTFGDFYRSPRVPYGHKRSLHPRRLAADLNLFKDGKWLRKTSDHRFLGEFWEFIGGAWGGRFKERDGNHYALAHQGMR